MPYQSGPVVAARTSATVLPAPARTVITVPHAPAARAVATSPSGCAHTCVPAGGTMTGKDMRWPSTVVDRSRSVTSARKRGRTAIASNASRLRRTVISSPAPPATTCQ